jgi:hypothetical protein
MEAMVIINHFGIIENKKVASGATTTSPDLENNWELLNLEQAK